MNKKSILIADDDRDLVQCLTIRARRMGLEVMTAYDSLSALTLAVNAPPDVICLDVDMPCGNGLSAAEMLAGHERIAGTPLVIMTGRSDDGTIRRCHELCAYYVAKCANVWERLEPVLRHILDLPCTLDDAQPQPARIDGADVSQNSRYRPRTSFDEKTATKTTNQHAAADSSREVPHRKLIDNVFAMLGANAEYFHGTTPDAKEASAADVPPSNSPWILCIDDDEEHSNVVKMRLESQGFRIERAFEGVAGFRQACLGPANAILLDFEMPNGQGDYILGRLKSNPLTQDIPVIVITGRKERSLERKMFNLGAAAFMNKPIDFDKLLEELHRARLVGGQFR